MSETRRRSDGERSHNAILDEAAKLATVEGLEGLTIGRLADAVGMSKSGLFSHFGSKEGLQLATIEAACDIFDRQVVRPADGATTGLERLMALVDAYLRYDEAETIPGGSFFASALVEVSARPGAVRDRLVAFLGDWLNRLQAAIADAQADGTLDPTEDPAQLTFEIESALFLANTQYVVMRTPEPLERARRAIDRRLEQLLQPPASTTS